MMQIQQTYTKLSYTLQNVILETHMTGMIYENAFPW
jgi:hypothetical protein